MKKYQFIEKNNTHIVLKREDVDQLDLMDLNHFGAALRAIREIRKSNGKNPNSEYIVVNRDEPYADTVMGIIKKGEEMKHHKQTCRVCGCDDLHSCKGGCYWVEEDLCSQCHEKLNTYYIMIAKDIATSGDETIPLKDFKQVVIAEEVGSLDECEAFIEGYVSAKFYNLNFEVYEKGQKYYRFGVFNYTNQLEYEIECEAND